MKVYKSPINKFVKTKHNGYLIIIGKNGVIQSVTKRFIFIYKLGLFSNKNKQKLLEYGILLDEPYNKFLIKVKTKSYKMSATQIPNIWILPTMGCNLKCPYCFVKPHLQNKTIVYIML